MIEAIEKNLRRGIKLLNTISDQEYTNNTIPPYFSSIGCHMRHVLDIFSCVLDGFKNGEIDLTKRERNLAIELKTTNGVQYFESIINQIKTISENDLETNVIVKDNLGLGKVSANYSLAAILMQAQSHTIHHYASIGYIVYQLGITLEDSDFGYNPTTPNKNISAS